MYCFRKDALDTNSLCKIIKILNKADAIIIDLKKDEEILDKMTKLKVLKYHPFSAV